MLRLLLSTFFIVLFSISSFSQETDQQQKQREKFEKEMREKEREAISEFVDELEADDFLKEIITQKLHSYSSKRKKIYTQQLRQIQIKEKIDYLNDTHFESLKSMASPEVMGKIKDFVTMTPSEKKKKEKKKRKRKNKNKDTDQK